MLEVRKKYWFEWVYTVMDGQRTIAKIHMPPWRARHTLIINNTQYLAYRQMILWGAFVLEKNGAILALANKPSIFRNHVTIWCGNTLFTLKPHPDKRGFELLSDSGVKGTLTHKKLFSFNMLVNLPDELPLPTKVFMAWISILLWNRISDSGY